MDLELILITGMSGSGKSVALNALALGVDEGVDEGVMKRVDEAAGTSARSIVFGPGQARSEQHEQAAAGRVQAAAHTPAR